MRLNTDGMGGSTSFTARTMRESCKAVSSEVKRLFARMLATSHVATRVARTATATPATESTGPRRKRLRAVSAGTEEPARTSEQQRHAKDRQCRDHGLRRHGTDLCCERGVMRAPTKRPNQNPP